MPDQVYLDYSATTPVDPRVVDAMAPYQTEVFGNPNSLYSTGRESFAALEEARRSFARSIGAADSGEVVFTGCGTEADNAALVGIARANSKKGGHVVVSSYEHHAVLEPAHYLKRSGFEVSHVDPREDGIVHPEDLERHVREDTVVVSVMHANNEIGTVNPLRELAAVARQAGAAFHTDAVQSLGKVPLDVDDFGVDAASFSAHKIYGPKGVGALYLRKGTRFEPLLTGGGQESGRRSGTQNVSGAVGIARAAEIMVDEMDDERARLSSLRDAVIDGVESRIENVQLNGSRSRRLPSIANFIIKGVEGESMLLHLDEAGFAISTGSACSSTSLEPSHVLMAIGCPKELAHGSLRVSVGRFTTPHHVEAFLDALVPIVERLRSMSPVYEKMFGTSR